MLTTPKWLGLLAVAFVAGSFIASPELRAFAANTVGSADIINESILSVDIKNGEVKTDDIAPSAVGSLRIKDNDVKAQDIAPNAVGASEIANGAVTSAKIADETIAYADLSRSLIAVEHRADCNCGGTGWDPDGTARLETIHDGRITLNSVVSVTVVGAGPNTCGTYIPFSGAAGVICTNNISNGASVNYSISNNPAYG